MKTEPTKSDTPHSILIIQSCAMTALLEVIRDFLPKPPIVVDMCAEEKVRDALQIGQWSLILCDVTTSVSEAATILSTIQIHQPHTPLVFVADAPSIQDAVNLMRLGARALVDKADVNYLRQVITEELAQVPSDSMHAADEDFYRSIVDSQQDLICCYGPDLRLTYVNPAYSKWRGVPVEKLIGFNILEYIPPEEHERIRAHIRSLSPDQPAAVSVHRSIMDDQSVYMIEWRDRAIFDENGQIIEYLGVGRDVTERERQAEELRATSLELVNQRNQFNDILSTMQDALMSMSLVDRSLIMVSQSFEDVIGYPLANFLDDPDFFRKIVHPDDLESAVDAIQTCLTTGFVELDHRIVLPDGEVRWLRRRVWVNYDDEGCPIRVNDTARNITESKLAEAALRTSEEKYRSLVDSSDAAISMIDADGRYLFVNQIASIPYGVPPEELSGKHVSELFAEDEAASILRDVRQVIRENKGKIIEPELKISDMSCWFRTSIQPVRDHAGMPFAAVIHASEITEKKLAEQKILTHNEILHQSRDFIALADVENGIIFLNKGAVLMIGGEEPDDFVGMSIRDFYLPEDADAVLNEYIPEMIRTGYWRGENRLKTLDGRVIEVDQTLFPIHDAYSGAVQVATIMVDISERKQAEALLRKQEEQYRLLAENMADVVWVLDTRSMKFTYVSPSVEMLRGVTAEEVLQESFDQVMTPASLEMISSVLPQRLQAFFAGDPDAATQRHEIEQLRKDGSIVMTEVVTTLLLDDDGTIRILGVSRDISERLKAEAALRQSEQRFQTFVAQFPGTVFIYDHEDRLVYGNSNYAKLLNVDIEDILGKTFREYLLPDTAVATEKENQELRTSGRSSMEFSFKEVANGRYWQIIKFLMPQDDAPALIGCISLDVTSEQVAKNALQEAYDLLEQRVIKRTEELMHANERLEAIFDHSGDGILLLDLVTGIRQANTRFEEIFGISRDAYKGGSLSDFLHADHAHIIDAAVADVAETHQTRHVEARLVRDSGEIIHMEISIAPVNRSDKAVTNLVCIIRDITERKQMQAALATQYEELDRFFRVTPDLLCIADTQGRFIKVNDAWEVILGYSPQELDGSSFLGLVHPDDLEATQKVAGLLANQHEVLNFTNRYRRKDGQYRYIEWVAHPHGDLIYAAAHDITERREAEDAIAEERKLLRTVIDTVPDYIYVKDLQHRMLLNNIAHTRSFGLENPEDAVGKTDFDFFPHELAAEFYDDEERLYQTGEPVIATEERTLHANGTYIWALTTKVPLHNVHGELIGLVGITHDISRIKASEEALRNSEERYRTTIAAMSEGLIVHDLEGRITFCNAAAERILGLSAEVLTGGHYFASGWWQVIQEDGTPFTEATHPVKAAISAGEARANIVMGIRKPDGQMIWLLTNFAALHDDDGAIYAVVTTFTDITDRKAAEAQLREKHQEELQMQIYLKKLHEISILLTRTETLDDFYRAAVEQARKHFDFERVGLLLYDDGEAVGTYGTNLAGETISEHHYRLNPADLTGIMDRTLDRSTRFAFDEDAELFADLQKVGRGQNVVATLWNGRALGWIAADNAIQHRPISKVQLDIMALYALTVGSLLSRKRAEQEARILSRRLEMATRVGGIGIFDWYINEHHLFWDDGMVSIYGIVESQVRQLADQWLQIIHPEDRERMQLALPSVIGDGSVFDIDYRIVRPDGCIRYVKSSGLVLTDEDGMPYRLLGVSLDVTGIKEAEQMLRSALEKEKELGDLKSRFVSMASHEFRTPLATILASTETLSIYRERMTGDQIDTRLEKIRQQVEHMKDIMEDVLRLARMQAERIDFHPVAGDLDDFCQAIVSEFNQQPEYHGRIIYNCSSCPVEMHFDPRMMRQVISNLIHNALKYSETDKLVYICLDCNDEEISLAVKDEGIGIPEMDLKHLFEPFHRATNVGTIAGTGLGLSITRQAIAAHQGRIEVESKVNKGSVFTLYLPSKLSEMDKHAQDSRS